MKMNALGIKLLTAVICLAVLGYFAVEGYHYFSDPMVTSAARPYQSEKAISVTGWVVREEQVLAGDGGGLLRLSRQEGEKVSRGGEIGRIYPDQASLDRQTQIDTLSARLDQLLYVRESAGGEATLKLDGRISGGILTLSRALFADRLDTADGAISELRSLVLKRDYTYSGGDLDEQVAAAEAELKALRSQAASSTRAVTAGASGLFSAVTDGYESVLTPETVETLTPSALDALAPAETGSGVGRLILGDTWYFAANLTTQEAGELEVGKSVSLRFAKGNERLLRVRLERVSAEESGRVTAVFSCRQYLSELTLLRAQSASIVLRSVSGLRVPGAAVRVDEEGVTGVYCVVGVTARFKPVTVTYTGDGFVLVKAASTEDRAILRAGDQVILRANDLYDGKIVG